VERLERLDVRRLQAFGAALHFELDLLALLLAACAERPAIGITISNTPAPIGACAPPKPGAGCP